MTSELPQWPYPLWIAHRGAGKHAPENTLSAMRVGFEHGFSMMEYDVKLSADLQAILLHDDDLDRTTNGQGPASLLPLRDLLMLDAGGWHSARYAGETVPTLQAVARYTQANGIASNIEIKPSRHQESLTGHHVALLARKLWTGVRPAPLLSSFSTEALQAAMQAAPELPRGLLIDHPLETPDLENARRLSCISIHMKDACTDKSHIEASLNAGLKVVMWTVNDAERARQLLNWGCSGIVTDNISPASYG